MLLELDNLPDDTALLHRLVRDMAALVDDRDGEIERLRQIVKELQRMRFGRRSEQLDLGQFSLGLEDLGRRYRRDRGEPDREFSLADPDETVPQTVARSSGA